MALCHGGYPPYIYINIYIYIYATTIPTPEGNDTLQPAATTVPDPEENETESHIGQPAGLTVAHVDKNAKPPHALRGDKLDWVRKINNPTSSPIY